MPNTLSTEFKARLSFGSDIVTNRIANDCHGYSGSVALTVGVPDTALAKHTVPQKVSTISLISFRNETYI